MNARSKFLSIIIALVAVVASACSDNITSPIAASSAHASLSGGSSTGGGSTAVLPRVVGTWTGHEVYDSTLAVFFLSPDFMTVSMSITLAEDVSGSITGMDNVMHQAITGKAQSNGAIVLLDGSYYGTRKMSMTIAGTVACADGTAGVALTGTFQTKEGFGTIALDNCLGAK